VSLFPRVETAAGAAKVGSGGKTGGSTAIERRS